MVVYTVYCTSATTKFPFWETYKLEEAKDIMDFLLKHPDHQGHEHKIEEER